MNKQLKKNIIKDEVVKKINNIFSKKNCRHPFYATTDCKVYTLTGLSSMGSMPDNIFEDEEESLKYLKCRLRISIDNLIKDYEEIKIKLNDL